MFGFAIVTKLEGFPQNALQADGLNFLQKQTEYWFVLFVTVSPMSSKSCTFLHDCCCSCMLLLFVLRLKEHYNKTQVSFGFLKVGSSCNHIEKQNVPLFVSVQEI